MALILVAGAAPAWAQTGPTEWATTPMAEPTTVTLCIEDGPLPAALSRYQSQVKRDLNIDLQFARHPFVEQFPITYLDLTNAGRCDIVSFWPTYMGDFGPFLTKLGDIAPGGDEQAWQDMQMDDVHPGYQWVAYDGPDLKALQYDGDVKILHYRADRLNDPAEQAAFKEQYGYDLGCPADWDQYLQMAQFFTRPDEDFYGSSEIAGFLSYFTFIDRLMGYGGHLFDPADMTPLPDRELALKTIQNMIDTFRTAAAPEATSFEFGDARNQILTLNRTAFLPMWPDGWKWGGDPSLSNSEGNIWTCVMPGGRPDMAGGRIMGISQKSDAAEAAYKVLAFYADGDLTAQLVNDNTAWMDPWRLTHMEPTLYNGSCPSDPARCENFVDTIEKTIAQGYPVLNIPGSGRYHEIIERLATSAIVGTTDAQQTLDQMVAELDAVTDELGREQQAAEYAEYVELFLKPKGLHD
jgi:multiple sugar transport system substrate-binding protein